MTGFLHFENVVVYDGKTKRCRMDAAAMDVTLTNPGNRNVGWASDGDGQFTDTPVLCSQYHELALIDLTRMNHRPVKVRVRCTWSSQNDGADGTVGISEIFMMNR